MLFSYGGAKAQLTSNYSFSKALGTYTPITTGGGASVFKSGTYDYCGVSSAITIPSFNFNGSSYTSLQIQANGYVVFGSTVPNCDPQPISSSSSYSGVICASGYYSYTGASGTSPSIIYQQVGSEFIVQWTDHACYYQDGRFGFQIRMNTCNGVIKIVYDSVLTQPTGSYTARQVGLRGSSNSDYLNRTSSSGTWFANDANGSSNSAYCNMGGSGNRPDKGLTYTYTPSSGSSMAVNNINYSTASVNSVSAGSNANEIIRMDIDVQGVTGTQILDTVIVTSNNTADADVSKVKLYVSSSNVFSTSTATQIGAGAGVSFVSGKASFYGLNHSLPCAVTYLYVVYDVVASPTMYDYLDAKINAGDIHISGVTFPSTNKSPVGNRQLIPPMTYTSSTVTQASTVFVTKGSTTNAILGINVDMSVTGSPINMDSIVLHTTGTNGTNNATTNISNAKIWYTANSSAFAATTQYGSTIAAPNGQMNFLGTQPLTNNTNYFWLTYDIKSGANTGDSVDARAIRMRVAGTAQTPTVTSPAGYRRIIPAYCTPSHSYNYSGLAGMGITNVSLNNLNVTTTAGATSSPAYTTSNSFATVQRKSNPTLAVSLGAFSGSPIGIVAWIDFNQDGDFYDAGEQVVTTASGNGTASTTHTFVIPIPCTSSLGYTKIRVMAAYYSASYWSDPCITYGYGETEDYLVNVTDSPLSYAASFTAQNNTLAVSPGTSNVEIIAMPVITSGCNGSLNATSFSLNANGSTSVSGDVTGAKIYWTGNSSAFATTTQFGSTYTGSMTASYNITGTQALVSDTNWFWLAYNLNGGATISNVVDGEFTSVTVGGNAYTPSSTAPSGSRVIDNPMTWNSTTGIQPSTGSVGKGTRYHAVLGVQINMSSGSSVNLTQLKWQTNGTNNITSNVDTARIYYTGNSATFAPTTLFGTYQLSPAATTTYTVNSTRALLPGNNYFWVVYSIKTGANTGDSVDARVSQVTIAGSPYTPSVTDPTGKRKIIPQPCTPYTSGYNYGNGGITNVSIGSINNNTGLPAANNTYTDYTSMSTTIQRGSPQSVSVTSQTYQYMYTSVWVDWNQDGTFQSTEKLAQFTDATSPVTNLFNFTVPCNAALGQARMRVKEEYFYQTGGTQDPCNDLYYGYYDEIEDYTLTISDSALTVVSATTLQNVTLAVGTGTNNNQIVRVQVVTKGCTGTQTLTSINLNTTGNTDPQGDIDSAIIYFTGNSNTFATTTLFGKIAGSSLSSNANFSITGSRALVTDTNNFWLVYNVPSSATVGDYLDAQANSVDVNSVNYSTTIPSPSGNRQILNPMSYTSSYLTQTAFNGMPKGSSNQKIAGLEIVMSTGTSINLDSLIFTNTGTANFSTNVSNMRCFYTGNSSAFATTTQYASTLTTVSGGEIRFGQSMAILPGTNYFWLTYDIKTSATTDDSIDATIARVRIAGSTYTPSPTTVTGKRYVIPNYCDVSSKYYNSYNYGITNVSLGAINNTTNTPTAYAQYNDYTAQSATLYKYQSYTLSLSYLAQYGYGNIAAWIDWNGDGDFADAGEKIGQPAYSTGNSSGTVTINFTVPCAGVVTGQTRMRICEEYYANGGQPLDPCNYVYPNAGETEDYTVDINNNPLTYTNSTTTQQNTSIVPQGSNNAEVIGMLINTSGCGGTLNVTQLNFNTTGTTAAAADITNAKVWFTGLSNAFAAITQFGSAVASPNGNFSISGTQALNADSNHFWLTYNVNSGATNGNKIDAQCTGITVGASTYSPSISNPSGDRTIASPATYNTHTWSKYTISLGTNSTNNKVARVKITMNSGAGVNLDSLIFNTTGNTSASDVTNANVWFTGSSSTFATTTQYGATIASPNGTLSIYGSAALQPGDNYFWFTYDIPSGATLGDSVNANLVRLATGGSSYNASPATIAGKSRIRATYCTTSDYQYNQYGVTGISNVTLGGINNTSSVPSSTTTYSDYTSQTGTLQKAKSSTISVSWSANYSSYYGAVWIDWNGDGDWTDAGENIGEYSDQSNYSGTYTMNITPPCTAAVGSTRMRIRSEYYGYGGNLVPCAYNYYYAGEVEDYSIDILDSPRSILSSVAALPLNLDVQPGSTNQQILKLRINSAGCGNNLNVTQLNFSTAGTPGSTNASGDITNAKVWYTGNSPIFATTTQWGSTVSSPNGAFTVNGSTTIANDSVWYWLTYDIASGATVTNVVDAKITSMVVSSSSSTPTNSDPSGSRAINNPSTYVSSSMTMPFTSAVAKGGVQQKIVLLKITQSSTGSPVPLNSIKLNTTGCTDPTTDISNAKLFLTGASTTFSSTYQYGSTIAAPNGVMSFTSSTDNVNPGDNYLWLTYDIKSGATTNDSVTAKFDSVTVNGTAQVPTNTTVSTKRKINPSYCAPSDYYYNQYGYPEGITNVTFAGINNTTSAPSGSSTTNDYSYLTASVQKSQTYTISLTAEVANYWWTGYTGVWIDWNNDGTFSSGEKIGETSDGSGGSSTGQLSVTIPCSATLGSTRMRIVHENHYGGSGALDPCYQYAGYLGETEDYSVDIADSSRNITSTNAFHPSLIDVMPGATNAQIMGVRINAAGCGTYPLTNVTMNTSGSNGTTATSDITNAKLWYTTTNVFATTTQYGSTISSPNGAMSFSGSQTVPDSCWLWLTYNVASGATIANYLDAAVTSLTINSNTYNPTNSSPTGGRQINYPATYVSSSLSMPITSAVTKGINNQSIVRILINMSSTGSTIALDSLKLTTTGCTAPSTDIQNAKIWYTGSSAGFAATTQFGSTIASPNGTMKFGSTTVLLVPGANYFYLSYDIKTGATTNDSVTATLDSVVIAATGYAPSNSTVSTKRRINAPYCTPSDYSYNQYGYAVGMTNVTVAGINNTTTVSTSSTTHSDYTAQHASVQKAQAYTMTVAASNSGYYTQYVAAWVDWNNDGTFASGEKLGEVTVNSSTATCTFNFTTPCSALAGTTRLRVRGEYYANGGGLDPCNYNYNFAGETEDYSVDIIDSPRNITSVVSAQPVTVDVSPSNTNAQIMRIRVNSQGCGTAALTQLNFNTAGTTSTSDITNAKVWYTASSPTFATTTQFGSTLSSPSAAFSITGTQNLTTDSAWFWLTYDIASGASIGNLVDAEGTAATINATTYSSVATVTGSRTINIPASYVSATSTQASVANIVKGNTNNAIIGAQIVMTTGSAQNATNLEFTVVGSQNVSTNISNAKCWYTGTSNAFATTTQYGSVYNSPTYNVSFNGNQSLLPGTNYFWMTYDVPTSGNTGDSVDGTFEQFDLDSNGTTNTYVPSVTAPAGKRKLVQPYCTAQTYQYNQYSLTGITNVTMGTINNTTSVPNSTSTNNSYLAQSTDIQKAANYTLSVSVSTNYTPQYTAAWIDFDGDANFDASEKLGQVGTNGTTGTVSFSFTVPCGASLGSTRMRVRNEYYANNGQALDPCNYTYYYGGEVEDYSVNITDSPLTVVSVTTSTSSTLDVFAGATNQQMIAIPVVLKGCSGSKTITQLDLNTNGSSSASNDIANAKVWFTGSSNVFAASTQFGSTSSGPVGNFSVSGSMALASDTNWFWVTYDIASGATTNNNVDVECSSVTVSSSNYTPTTQAPSGSRMINVAMSYTSSTTVAPTTSPVEKGKRYYEVADIQVVMSTGATVNLTQLNLSTGASTNASGDIDTARVYFTGNSGTFATTTLFATQVGPNGTFTATGTQALVPGTNHFWVSYSIKTGATTGDSVTACCSQITINAATHTPTVTCPAGKRKVIAQYCTPTWGYNGYNTQMYIARVKIGSSIDNTTSYGSGPNYYTYYSSQTCSLTITGNDTIKVEAGSGYTQTVNVYIDANQDGDFADAGESLGGNTSVGTSLANIPVSVASGALIGTTRLRVISTYYGYSVATACGSNYYAGECEDYNVVVLGPNAPNATISPNTATSMCQGIGQVFTASPVNNAYTYTWKEGATVKLTGTGTSYATYSYNPAYTGTYSITCTIADQYSQTGVSPATTITINSNPVGGTTSVTSTALCSGQTDTLSVSGNSGSPQWQSKVGAGAWTDISGATTTTYVVMPSVTTSYRCKSTLGVCGSAYSTQVTVSIGTAAVWIGAYSTVWTYGPNWCSGTVPTNSSNVTISTGTFQPVLTSTVYCSNLTINSGATLTINNGGVLQIGGTFTKNGTLTHNYGKIIFTSPQTLPANAYYWLSLNGSGTYTLSGNTIVNSNLNIVSGVTVATAGFNLTAKRDVACNGTISGTGNLVLDNSTLNQTVSG
ncbi:MAG: BNR-repeat neuraminidase N-terminal domain-containing protein, partial [Bacteroidota bacterium]|nr:BNR-repeat neuraminidase N-terminal domain-containing protein [Bacteroidota bacterium]